MSRALVIITALQLLPAGALASHGYVAISQAPEGCDASRTSGDLDTLEIGAPRTTDDAVFASLDSGNHDCRDAVQRPWRCRAERSPAQTRLRPATARGPPSAS